MCWCFPVKDIEYEPEPRARKVRTTTAYRYQWNGQSWDLQQVRVPAVSRSHLVTYSAVCLSVYLPTLFACWWFTERVVCLSVICGGLVSGKLQGKGFQALCHCTVGLLHQGTHEAQGQ